MNPKRKTSLIWLITLFFAAIGMFGQGIAPAQVLDADCFSGACGGQKGIPQCPDNFGEVGMILYANSKANAARDCETVVSCTNLNARSIEISCRFHHGFFPIRPGGPGEALCSTSTPDVAPGDTTECATDATQPPNFQAAGIFSGADGDCPTFEGKGLVCVKGGNPDRVLCQAHLVCGNGAALERIDITRTERDDSNNGKDKNDKWDRKGR